MSLGVDHTKIQSTGPLDHPHQLRDWLAWKTLSVREKVKEEIPKSKYSLAGKPSRIIS
jgi:hypothetical protein